MAENIEFIPANELPEAEGEEVSVLCLENGELKQKSGASLGGGTVEPDMVITITGSLDGVFASECTVTSGNVSNIVTKLSSGKIPVVKIRNVSHDSRNSFHNEFDAFVTTYGENFWLSSLVIYPPGPGYYKLNMTLNSDGSINTAATSTFD